MKHVKVFCCVFKEHNLKTKKVIISRNVIFDENAIWNWEKKL